MYFFLFVFRLIISTENTFLNYLGSFFSSLLLSAWLYYSFIIQLDSFFTACVPFWIPPTFWLIFIIYLFWGMSQSYIKIVFRSIAPSSSQLTCSSRSASFYIFPIRPLHVTNLVSGLPFLYYFCTNEKIHVHFLISFSFSLEG